MSISGLNKKDERIMQRLQEHLDEGLKIHPCDWFVICAQGSVNYNLDDEESDVDSKWLVIPSLEDIVLSRKPKSTTHILENDEHVDEKDVREYFKLFEKANINFVEILFSDYWICNPQYLDLWLELLKHREEIGRMNPYNTYSCIKGMASEKVHALCHEYPSRMYYIKKYGYDGKQLSHLMRLEDFICKYMEGQSYKDCMSYNSKKDTSRREEIIQVKRHKIKIDKTTAIRLSIQIFDKIAEKADTKRKFLKKETNPDTLELLEDILYRLIKRSLKNELSK